MQSNLASLKVTGVARISAPARTAYDLGTYRIRPGDVPLSECARTANGVLRNLERALREAVPEAIDRRIDAAFGVARETKRHVHRH